MSDGYIIGRAVMRKILEIEGQALTDADEAFLKEIEGLPQAERTEHMIAYVKETSVKKK